MRVCAFDLGVKNFAVAIESFDRTKLNGQQDDVYMEGKIEFVDKQELSAAKGGKITTKVLKTLNDYIKTLLPQLQTCDVILIEKQFKCRGVQNAACIHLEHHLNGILMWALSHTKTKIEVYASRHKTKAFESQKMTKIERKKWTVEETTKLLLSREDYDTLDIFNKKKKDDMADVIMMIQAYKMNM